MCSRAGLFSATQTEAVEALARAGLRNPVRVNVAVTLAQPPPSKKREKGEWVSRVVLLAGSPLRGRVVQVMTSVDECGCFHAGLAAALQEAEARG